MSYIGNSLPANFQSLPAVQRFNGNASATAFTLASAVANDQSILVSVDGVTQDSNAYSVSGTTLTFTAAPSAGTGNIFVNTISPVGSTVVPPDGLAITATTGTFSGALAANGGAVFNEGSADVDFRVESNGNANMLFVDGGSDHVNIGTSSDFGDTLNVSGSAHCANSLTLSRQSADTGSTGLIFEKTRNTSVNGNTVVANNDQLGFIAFRGNDGDQFLDGAYIISFVDGTPGNNDMPTRMSFQTTADGASSPTERMRITSVGQFIMPGVYTDTTSDSANINVRADGLHRRNTSSLRYKNTVNDATHGLTELLALRPVTYKGNNDGDTVFGGLIAEEVHDAGLTEFVYYDSENRPDALRYPHMVSLCIKAIQELSEKIAALEAK